MLNLKSFGIKSLTTELFIVDPKKPNEYSLKELMTPELLSREELTEITISRGHKSTYGNTNQNHGICYYQSFGDFYAFVFSNPLNDHTFSAKVTFTLQNYSLERCENDTKKTWKVKVGPNQSILKLMKKVDPTKASSWKNSTSYEFLKE